MSPFLHFQVRYLLEAGLADPNQHCARCKPPVEVTSLHCNTLSTERYGKKSVQIDGLNVTFNAKTLVFHTVSAPFPDASGLSYFEVEVMQAPEEKRSQGAMCIIIGAGRPDSLSVQKALGMYIAETYG